MAELLFGVETEYAITGMAQNGAVDRDAILPRLMDHARRRLIQLPDLNSPGGMFLQNGCRFYIDCLHPEICTPECISPRDAVRYIEAGHTILAGLVSSVESASAPGTEIICFRCNVDYSGAQSTWGCHESYMHRMPQSELQSQIVPHLVTRLIYTGAGGFNPFAQGLAFTLAPRMAHFRRVVTESSTSERGIWHSKSEPLCSGYSRLHVLCGESLCSQTANFLKIGATALIVAMADAGLAPGRAVQLADPLVAMHFVAADVTCKGTLAMADGSRLTAIAIQRHYLEIAEAHLGSDLLPAWAGEVCHCWRAILDQLEDAPQSVSQNLDWGIKFALYENHARRLGIRWDALSFSNKILEDLAAAVGGHEGSGKAKSLERAIAPRIRRRKEVSALDPLLHSLGLQWEELRTLLSSRQEFFEIDTRFGQLREKGIFHRLDHAGVLNHRVSGVDNLEQAVTEPPAGSRARVRGQVIQRLAGSGHARCDWQGIINYSEGQTLDLTDPFTQEELWHPSVYSEPRDEPLSRAFGGIFISEEGPGATTNRGPYARRQDAADRILSGDYAGAEVLLRELLQEHFMVPSTLCHLARVLLMTDREGEAREQIHRAWAIREEASAYVVPRILFFQCVFAIFDEADIDGLIARIKSALRADDPHMDWTIHLLLDRIRQRLGEPNYEFLTAVAAGLSDAGDMTHLNDFPRWRDAAIPGDAAA